MLYVLIYNSPAVLAFVKYRVTRVAAVPVETDTIFVLYLTYGEHVVRADRARDGYGE